MNLKDLKKKNLPDKPGVYFFKKGQDILYIGKATSLKDRTKSYFSNDLIKTRGPAILDMVTQSSNVTFTETDSVLEALLLETALIKKHQPRYNVKEKDNKSFNLVIITDEEYPRVLIKRDREIKTNPTLKIRNEFGPFPSAGQLKEALKIVRKIFPFLDEKSFKTKNSRLNIELGLAPDLEKVSKKEYLKTIKNIEMFFAGQKKQIIRKLEKEMKVLAKNQDFEKAGEIKKTIFALNHINDINLLSQNNDDQYRFETSLIRLESYDIAHLAGSNTVGVMVVMENGELNKNQYRKFLIKEAKSGDDYGALREVLRRRLRHDEWTLPRIFAIDGGKAQKRVAEKVLAEFGYQIPVISVVKDDKHKPKDILGDKRLIEKYAGDILKINQETHRFAISFYRKRSRKMLK